MTRPSQEIVFTSILLPHAPTSTPKRLLKPPEDSDEPKRIEVVIEGDKLLVVSVISEVDPVNKRSRETWVMLNDTGGVQKARPLESDALIAVIGHDTRGRVQHRAIVGGTFIRYLAKDETPRARLHQPSPPELPDCLRQ